jgi:hypothetical protein
MKRQAVLNALEFLKVARPNKHGFIVVKIRRDGVVLVNDRPLLNHVKYESTKTLYLREREIKKIERAVMQVLKERFTIPYLTIDYIPASERSWKNGGKYIISVNDKKVFTKKIKIVGVWR